MNVSLENKQSFEELYNTVKGGKGGISFFGVRYVYLENGQALHQDTLLSVTMQLLRKNPHFDERERGFGRKLVKKIGELRSESRFDAETSNFITQIFHMIAQCWISNFQDYGYGIRFNWVRERDFPDLYTKEQYEKLNGHSPWGDASDYTPDLPPRWLLGGRW